MDVLYRGSFTGTPPYGLHPCLYSIVPTGLCLGYRGGVWEDGKVTLLWSSIRSNVSLQGLLYRDSASLHPCLYCVVPTGLAFWRVGGRSMQGLERNWEDRMNDFYDKKVGLLVEREYNCS